MPVLFIVSFFDATYLIEPDFFQSFNMLILFIDFINVIGLKKVMYFNIIEEELHWLIIN